MNARLLLPCLLTCVHGGCGATTVDTYEACALDVVLTPASGFAGDAIVVTGGPFTEVRDTRVEVDGVAAEVTLVDRTSDCDDCDQCRLDAGCAPCGLCSGELLEPARHDGCFGDPFAAPVPGDAPATSTTTTAATFGGACGACVESVTFVVPAGVPPGPTAVWMLNRDGASASVPFTVLGTGGSGATGGTGAASTGGTGAASTGGTGAASTGGTGARPATGGTGARLATGGTGGGTTGGTGR